MMRLNAYKKYGKIKERGEDMKKAIVALLTLALSLFFMLVSPIIDVEANEVDLTPELSHLGGFYMESFYLTITPKTNTSVYYTLDGSTPSKNSYKYVNPLLIEQQMIEADGSEVIITETSIISGPLSMIVTTDKNWISPKEDIFKANVVRVIAYEDDTNKASDVITHTYFVDPNMYSRYTFPIFSLTTDASNLYDYENGISVPGTHYDPTASEGNASNRTGNYFMTGNAWERLVYVEFYDTSGILQMAQHAGLRIHGGLSRKYPIKSYRLYAKTEYDEQNTFHYQFFKDKEIDDFKRLILRNGGQAYQYTFMGEAFAQSLLKPLDLDIQYSTPIILFINGEYFGIRNVRDRFDVHYLESHYGIDENRSTILTGHAYLEDGSKMGQAHYQTLYTYASIQNLALDKHYKKINRWMDVDNYIDYMIAEIYFGNVDWPQNNVLYWRKNTSYNPDAPYGHDGRWRWMVNDLDGSFGISWGTVSPSVNSFERLTGETWKTGKLFVNLLENDTFKAKFIYRMLELLDTIFEVNHVTEELEIMVDLYKPEMEEHIARFGYPSTYQTWLSYTERMKRFAEGRKDYLIAFMEEYFNLSIKHPVAVTYNREMGSIEVNQIEDQSGLFSGEFYHDLPITLVAIPSEGYRFAGWYYEDMELSKNEELVINPELNLILDARFELGEPFIEEKEIDGLLFKIIFSLLFLGEVSWLIIIIKKKKISNINEEEHIDLVK